MSAELNIALKALHHAGDVIQQLRARNELLSVSKKISNGYVAKAEQASLNALFYTLQKAYPQDDIQTADESLTENKKAERCWHIIPMDGSSNLLYDIAHCAVSVTLVENNKTRMTMIYNPLNDDLFSASAGSGCFFNQKRVRLDKETQADQIILATNKPLQEKSLAPHLLAHKNISKQVIDVKSLGCPLLDIAMVGSGQIDGYWQSGISDLHVLATELLIKESGGQCLDFSAGDQMSKKQQLIAGNINNATWLAAQLKGIYTA